MDWQVAMKEYAALVDKAMPKVLADLEPKALREAALHYPNLGGKRWRPGLAMLSCEAAGGKAEDALHAGIAVELVHNFSLVHDDIMDGDAKRRGAPTVHKKWDTNTAILAGDALFAKAFEAIDLAPAEAERKAAMLHELAIATRKLCEGQQRDVEMPAQKHATPQDYFEMIHGKTGRLYECAARLGGLASGASGERVEALAAYGRAFGRAFQVRDDVLGVAGDARKTGKSVTRDITNGKRTIILLTAMERARGKDAALLRKVAAQRAKASEAKRVLAVFKATGALDEAQRHAQAAAQEAVDALKALPPSGARDALAKFAWNSVEREH